ncbi:haloacid dehalogenase type II [Arhodomonas aquaeolei]|uniref:haloacid dehalogenase type II n=1 Tax=Arhodomonas aquaeolei TaxID=2369 RepID=UPI0003609DA1|nr:haloacid dehalogenase type II [Arhodomonas aquaeolei]MCS4504578.1 haloacid dehalogenase type II [Arhodomonas aquaeolei]
MTRRLTDFSVLTFDCYGTLIDWESGIWDALQPVLHANGCTEITRETGLAAFAEFESTQQAETPGMRYPELLRRVHERFVERFGLRSDEALDRAFGESVPHWPAFPDSADALRSLARSYRLVILSNVDHGGFAASNRKLGVTFDAIYTAEDMGAYKPTPGNFEYMVNRLREDHGIAPEQILHTAQSLFHDHVPASHAGLARCWIDRQGLSRGGSWGATAEVPERPSVDFLFPDLAGMAAQVREEEDAPPAR